MKPIYKIRSKATGLYKIAGRHSGWNTVGKTWSSRGALSGHLALYYNNNPFRDIEVVVIEPVITKCMSVAEYRAEVKD